MKEHGKTISTRPAESIRTAVPVLPKICHCLTASTLGGWVEQIRRNRSYAHMYELRFDLLLDEVGTTGMIVQVDEIAERVIPELQGRPWIATARYRADLGAWPDDAVEERKRFLNAVVDRLSPAYIDLEFYPEGVEPQKSAPLIDLAEGAEESGTVVIRSVYSTEGIPSDPEGLLRKLASKPGELPKLAVTLRSEDDVLRLYNAAKAVPGKKIVVGMGEYGLITRVAPHLFGSVLSFSSSPASEGEDKATGQYTPQELSRIFRVGTVRPEWPLFAVLGSPVAHSRSPEYHNRRFAEDGVEALYVPIRADSFPGFIVLAEALSIQGVSVTVPHKEAAVTVTRGIAASVVSAEAEMVGAANTLVRERGNGGWYIHNTDVGGFLSALGDQAPRSALVIGAGGASRSIVAALVSRGVEVSLVNRTRRRALELAEHFGIDRRRVYTPDYFTLDSGTDVFGLVVQTTSVGMEPTLTGDPLPGYRFTGRETVYDIIYTPERTTFLARAEAAGCRTISGKRMFEAQADAQYRLFKAQAVVITGG